MDVQHHHHTHRKKWSQYVWDFFLLFLAITLGFMTENRREHYVEHNRMKRYLSNVLLDVESNLIQLDSLILENGRMLATYDSIVNEMLLQPASIDRYAVARKIFPVFMRLFRNRKETYDQLLMTGSLRYLDDRELMNTLVGYNRLAYLTEWRAMENERKIALEQNYPAIYAQFDMECLILDIPGRHADSIHQDLLHGKEAAVFCREVGKAIVSRIRFMRLSYDTYFILRQESRNLQTMLKEYLD